MSIFYEQLPEISIFIIGYTIGAALTFIILFGFYYITLKHLVTVNINNYPKYLLLPSYEEMLIKFWIWDFDKFIKK